ncbi:unnamed protein product [Acanthoscelides obtectus]|uniref:Uncharacterized protein n=1 Tax=Acanthoscelides obtectus TaxID=200917 RepID=A0A9P0PMI8_ACAOB|nr:unnamed protein product [Acanthoscelides obtectus]CAK1672509.1 Prominin-1-A [Acanthoscelides obtectus]
MAQGLVMLIVIVYCFGNGYSDSVKVIQPVSTRNSSAFVENCTSIHELLWDGKLDINGDYRTPREDVTKSRLHDENETEALKVITEWSNIVELQFLDIPRGDDMKIDELHLDEEQLSFETVSNLVSFLEPSQFPMDILIETYRNQTPVAIGLIVFKVLKMDIALISWTVIWAVICLMIPIIIMTNLCCKIDKHAGVDDNLSIDSDIRQEKTKRCFKILLQVLAILYLIPAVIILAANEQMAKALNKLPESVEIMYGDIQTFIKNTHMQISFAATSSTDIAIEEISKDLEAMSILLGVPYQQAISVDTGIDTVLFNLEDLKISAAKIAAIVADLMIDCGATKLAGEVLQEQLSDISRQLTVVRQQCTMKDRTLCYTLQYSGYDVTFTLENITKEEKLQDLEKVVAREDFNNSLDSPRKHFGSLPSQMLSQSSSFSADLNALLRKKRSEVFSSITSLDQLMRYVSESVKDSEHNATEGAQKLSEWSFFIWLAIVGISGLVCLTWILLLCGAPCTESGPSPKEASTLIAALIFATLTALIVWGQATVALILGVHGNAWVCQPLFDHPHYTVLSGLFDQDGLFYKNGVFHKFDQDANESITISNVLKNCQRDQPAYKSFNLHNQINVDKLFNIEEWTALKALLANFTLTKTSLEILGPSLRLNLQSLSTMTTANLTSYRLLASEPITRKDLDAFADQLNTVARQMIDPVSSRKMDNIAHSVRQIINNELHQLKKIKSDVLYKITMLEILLPPLNRQVNQSLRDLQRIQSYLDNEERELEKQNRKRYSDRLQNYLHELHTYVTTKVGKEIGKCRPLWKVYHSARLYVCKFIIDSWNTIALFSYFSILICVVLSPVAIKLLKMYKMGSEYVPGSIRDSQRGLIMDNGLNWATPPVSCTPEDRQSPIIASQHFEHSSPPVWATEPGPSRQFRTSVVPPTPPSPSKFPTISAGILKAKKFSRIIKPRSPKRYQKDSLKLVEPLAWKVGSTTPKSWI